MLRELIAVTLAHLSFGLADPVHREGGDGDVYGVLDVLAGLLAISVGTDEQLAEVIGD